MKKKEKTRKILYKAVKVYPDLEDGQSPWRAQEIEVESWEDGEAKTAGETLEALGQGADVKHPGGDYPDPKSDDNKIAFQVADQNTGEPYFEPGLVAVDPARLGICPDKLEPSPLNMVARERLERQISDLMDKANQALKERNFLFKDAMDILEIARTTAYTDPMGEVSVTIHEAARRLSDIEPKFSRTANRLGNLAMEIRQSEQVREGKK